MGAEGADRRPDLDGRQARPTSGWCRPSTTTTRSATARTSSRPRRPIPGPRSSTTSSRASRGLNVDPLIAFGQAVLAMNSLKLLDVPNPGNPDKKAIDEASKFLISKKKGGQFRALWGDFGELVNLLASGEMVICGRLAAGGHGGEGAGHALRLRRAEGRLSRLGDRRLARSPARPTRTRSPPTPTTGCRARPASRSPSRATTRRRPTSRRSCLPRNTRSGTRASPGSAPPERGIKEGDLRDGGSLANARRPRRLLAPVAGRVRLSDAEVGRVPQRMRTGFGSRLPRHARSRNDPQAKVA